jgi:hypothetical protein
MFGARLRKVPERLSQLTSPTFVQQQRPAQQSTLSVQRKKAAALNVGLPDLHL